MGLFQLGKLPIDAVPDITNRQVQINTVAPALTPEQIERQVTYPLETALAGIPGLTTTVRCRAMASRRSPRSSPMPPTSTSPASR